MKHPVLDTEEGLGDERLMDEVGRQSAEALEKIYLRHGATLRGVVLRILCDEAEADDVLQDVFLQLWKRATDYSPERGKPLGWLIVLARRRAIDRLRQRASYQRATERFEVELKLPLMAGRQSSATVHDAAFHGDLRELVDGAMQRLPEKQREVVERAYLDGMSQREVASELSLPLGTVKTRMELGMRKLERVLASSRRKIF